MARKKCRTEAQRRHDVLLHQSRLDPLAYRVNTLEDMNEMVKQQRKRACAAEADAEYSKKLLVDMQNQVHSSASMNGSM
jgi:hypothetical protein